MDDFLIHAPNIKEHDIILQKVMERAQHVGLRFNKNKSTFYKKDIKFIGYIFSEQGVKADPDKVRAISEFPPPRCVAELQRFLGMVNYLGSFIKNLSSKNKNLRDLLKKDIQWHWDCIHEKEFNALKCELTTAPVLTYFNVRQKLTMSVDASKFAVGAAIFHGKNPIAYGSASLTTAQINYAQIEKELFAILFGCVKFHQYIYGLKVIVETDHKPLVSLFNKPLFKIPARLQRFMLRLQRYDLELVYKPGKFLYVADTLSRAPLKETTKIEIDDELNLHCNFLASQIALPEKRLNEISSATRADDTLMKVKEYIQDGWPVKKKEVDKHVMPYFNNKDDFAIFGDLILKNNKVVIPSSLRKKILSDIHEGHMGIQRCLSLARDSVYWPNINNDIYNFVSYTRQKLMN